MDMNYSKVTVTNDSGDAFSFERDGRFCKVTLGKKFHVSGYIVVADADENLVIARHFFGLDKKDRIAATGSEVQELKDLISKFLP